MQAASAQCTPTFRYDNPIQSGEVGPGGMATTAWDPDGAGPQPTGMVFVGAYTTVGNVVANRVSFYNGTTHTQIGAGFNQVANAVIAVPGTMIGVTTTSGQQALVAGGSFTGPGTGTGTLSRVAVWDGTAWTQLGNGLSGTVNGLAVYNNQLIAFGFFATTASAPVTTLNRVAKYNSATAQWEPFGAGFSAGSVYCAAVHNGELYVGCQSTSIPSLVARWDVPSSTWLPVGAGLNGSTSTLWARALASFGGSLYVGGSFDTIASSGTPANAIARLSGTDWVPVTSSTVPFDSSAGLRSAGPTSPSVTPRADVRVLLPGTLGLVVAGFNLSKADANGTNDVTNINNAAVWTGTAWQPLGTGLAAGVRGGVNGAAYSGSTLYVTGTLIDSGEQAIPNYVYNVPPNLITYFVTTSGYGTGASGSAKFNGTQFVPLNSGFNSGVFNAPTSINCWGTWQGRLVAGGTFTAVNGKNCRRIAYFDGVDWQPLGAGLGTIGETFSSDEQVYAVAEYNGSLYAAGYFGQEAIDNNPTGGHIFRWNAGTSTWERVGGGVNGTIYTLLVKDGLLYAGGLFTQANATPGFNGIAAWDGSAWSQLGAGLSKINSTSTGYFGGWVLSLCNWNGELVAGGYFDRANAFDADPALQTVTPMVAKWNGSTWLPIGRGMCSNINNTNLNLGVRALSVFRGQLVAGGAFNACGAAVPANAVVINATGVTNCGNVAIFNGTDWQPMSTIGLGPQPPQAPDFSTDRVLSFKVYNRKLYACGEFSRAHGSSLERFNGIATWNPTLGDWESVETGIGSTANAMTINNGELWVGGLFTSVGGTNPTIGTTGNPCRYVARIKSCAADFNCSGGLEVQDIFDYLNAWFAGNPDADINNSGGLEVQDIFDFLNAWFAGC